MRVNIAIQDKINEPSFAMLKKIIVAGKNMIKKLILISILVNLS